MKGVFCIMKIYMIRHGMTNGNREHRYVGITDEGLIPEEREALRERTMPSVTSVYVSPRKRCMETAEILYPEKKLNVVNELAECDFGEFEYKNYEELNGNPDYQKFIDSMGKSGFPGGEDRDTFQKRCVEGFLNIMKREKLCKEDIAMVVHGGTIMAILDACSRPHKDYYDWQVKNGEGYVAEVVWDAQGGRVNLEDIREIEK